MKLLTSVVLSCILAVALASTRPSNRNSIRYPGVIPYDYYDIRYGYNRGYNWRYSQSNEYQPGAIKKKYQKIEVHEDDLYEWVGTNGVTYVVKSMVNNNKDNDYNDDQSEEGEGPGGVPLNIAASLLG